MAKAARKAPAAPQITGKLQVEARTVDPRRLKGVDRNARYMRHETFARLVANMRSDGQITSTPLVALYVWDTAAGEWFFNVDTDPDHDGILPSGNHRTRAAIEAELETIPVLCITNPISREHFRALQLSHNAIDGEDDPATLQALYDEIETVEYRMFSGLDDDTLALFAELETGSGLSEASLNYQVVSLAFFPDELEELRATWDEARSMVKGTETWAVALADFDAFMAALGDARAAHGVINVATALRIVLAVFDANRLDLRAGFLDDEGESSGVGTWVPINSVVGTQNMPAEAAAVVNRALDRMVDAGVITSKTRWRGLELWAADALAGEP